MKKLLCILLIIFLLPSGAFCAADDIDAREIGGETRFAEVKTEKAAVMEDDSAKARLASAEDVPDEYINKTGVTSVIASFKNNAEKTIGALARVTGKEMLMDGIWRIDFASAEDAQKAFVKLKKDENVRAADYDIVLDFDIDTPTDEEIFYDNADETALADAETAAYYNDYNTHGGWQLDDVNAPDAWDALKEYEGADKNSALVAVIDSGIDTQNPDLKNRIYKNSAGELVGYNLINPSSSSFEDDSYNNYHGTRVASAIAAEANNNLGICGLAGEFDVKILPIKVFSSSGPSASVLISAVSKAVEHNADVINMSLTSYVEQNAAGADNKIETLQEAINKATAAGCIVVAAAGNNFSNFPLYPASYDNVISVAAYNSARERSVFSQYNDYVDVSAPGESMTLLTRDNSGNTGYVSSSGTSFSAPMVSASAALLRIANPDITAVDASNVIKNTARDLGKDGYDLFYGFGALDLAAAIRSAEDAYIEMTSLEYTKSLSINVGEYSQVQTTILPKNTKNKILKFESANESVATVSNNGVVFGVSPGVAKILITADFDPSFTTDESGNKFYCTVTVAPDISFDGKTELFVGEATVPRNVSDSEFAMYGDGKIFSVKKGASGKTEITEERTVNLPYAFCEYLGKNAQSTYAKNYAYAFVRQFDHKFYFALNSHMGSPKVRNDTDEYNPTYTALASNGEDLLICSSTGNITYAEVPKTASETSPQFTVCSIKYLENKVFVTDAVYVPHEKCKFYVFVGHDNAGKQYLYLSDMSTDADGAFVFKLADVNDGFEKDEEYRKIFIEGQYVYLLTNKAVYRIKTGRISNEITCGTFAKYADIDGRLIKNIGVVTIGGERSVVGYGGGNALYLIAEGGTYEPIKTYDAPLTHVFEFNNELYTVSDGMLRSESVNVNAAQNKSYDSRLCTYGVNILDKNKKLVSSPTVDGKFTVEYYIESVDRIVFENSVFTNSEAQNRLPVSVVFSVYDKDTGELADVRVNDFMLDYFYYNSAYSAGANLRCEEEFNLGSGDYEVKVMTFMGNNFYWPEKNKNGTTLGVFTEALK